MKKPKTSEADKIIGLKLKELRFCKSMKMQEIAGILEVSIQQVSKYESGINRLPLVSMLNLCNKLKLDPTEFCSLGDKRNRERAMNKDKYYFDLNKYFNYIKDEAIRKNIIVLVKALADSCVNSC